MQLAEYRLIDRLGAAQRVQHTRIYLALTPQDKPVVVKWLDHTASSLLQQLFRHEIQVMQELDQLELNDQCMMLITTGTEKLHIEGQTQQVQYMVMPYIAQGSLARFLHHSSNSNYLDQALFLSMLDTVAGLHACGWLHLDLKPANFLIQPVNKVILTDFALSQKISSCASRSSNYTQGTPKYMSPEQFLAKPLSPQTDFYALGVIWYEWLTQRSLFHANTYMEWAIQHCQQPVPMLPNHLSMFQPLIDGLLAKYPHHRFAHSDQIKQHLDQAFQQLLKY